MAITVRDVAAHIEAWAPAGWAYDWDRAGLNVGAPDIAVSGVLVCLTVTRAAFDAARAAGANLIVAHHPAVWNPLRALRTDDPHTRLLVDMAAAGVACYSAHTNLDVAPGGVNHLLAAALGLREVRPLLPAPQARQVKLVTFVPEAHRDAVRHAMCQAGAGVIGDYRHCSFSTPGTGTFLPGEGADPFSGEKGKVNAEPECRLEVIAPKARLDAVLRALFEAHPYEEAAYDLGVLDNTDAAVGLGARGVLPGPMPLAAFAAHVRAALGLAHLRWCGDPARTVRAVGVLGGSGGGEIERLPRDLDAYVTGDVKYHDAEAAQARGLGLVDAGHHGTEIGIVPAMAQYLAGGFPALPATPYIEPEPFEAIVRHD